MHNGNRYILIPSSYNAMKPFRLKFKGAIESSAIAWANEILNNIRYINIIDTYSIYFSEKRFLTFFNILDKVKIHSKYKKHTIKVECQYDQLLKPNMKLLAKSSHNNKCMELAVEKYDK